MMQYVVSSEGTLLQPLCVFIAAWPSEAEIQLLLNHLPGREHSQPAQPQIHHQMVRRWTNSSAEEELSHIL